MSAINAFIPKPTAIVQEALVVLVGALIAVAIVKMLPNSLSQYFYMPPNPNR